MNFVEEQIERSIANRVAIEKAMGKDFTEADCLDLVEKVGKPAQMGEVRVWDGKEYIKTSKGWRVKPKGYKEGEKKQEESKDKEVKKEPSKDTIQHRLMEKFVMTEFASGRMNSKEKVGEMMSLLQKKLGISSAEAGNFIREAIGLK